MKPHLLILGLLAPAIAIGQQESAPPAAKKPAFRNAATHEELAQKLQQIERNDPMKKLAAAEGQDPSRSNPPADFLKNSDAICYNGVATFVPKRAILSAPANLKERLGIKPGVRIVGWPEFFALNRGWIDTVEVERSQAEGNKMLDEKVSESISKSGNLVVATFHGGPISVPPPVEPATQNQSNKK